MAIPSIMGSATGDADDEDRYDEPTDDVLAGAHPAAPGEATDDPVTDDDLITEHPAGSGPHRDSLAGDRPDSDAPDSVKPDSDEPDGDRPDSGGAVEHRAVDGAVDPAPEVTVLPERRERTSAEPVRPPLPGRQRPAPAAVHPPTRGRPAAVPSAIASKLETSPFWLGGDEHDRSAPAEDPGAAPSRLGVPPRRVPPAPRRPATGLVVLVLLSMVAAFFAWVSAEPLWLAAGHGERGTATVTRCTGGGVAQRCRGDFVADGGRVTVPGVALLGVAADRRTEGSVVPARLVSTQSRQAFVGGGGLIWHLRWAIGVLIVLLCGLGIAVATGARRLETTRARRTAMLISLAGPVALLAGFLAITY